MSDVAVRQIHLDPGGIRVVPDLDPTANYDAVDRAANRVRWDGATHSLRMIPRDDGSARTSLEAFQQILAAVASEYGDRLVLTPTTTFHFVTSEDRGAIIAWHDSPNRGDIVLG